MKRAFTLIELLVVISIIALLVGILLPALGAARKTAQAANCLSNQKQLTTAWLIYATEYKDHAVMLQTDWPGLPNAVDADRAYWPGLLNKSGILSDPKFYDCPSYDPERTLHLTVDVDNPKDGNWFYVQYGYNYLHIGSQIRNASKIFGGGKWYTVDAEPITPKMSDIRKPTSTVIFADSYGPNWQFLNSANESGIYIIRDSWNTPPSGIYEAHARHSSAVNTSYADGHVTAVKTTYDPIQYGVPMVLEDSAYTPDTLSDWYLQTRLAGEESFWDIY
ncbi:type II secretion system protein [Poriferisphaera sp. WC338]|uniref:type II secretion system protein n=1 Tax=Poriferisphaera sp. WC338 TaxID=3425129 RepID=UPI003D8182FB